MTTKICAVGFANWLLAGSVTADQQVAVLPVTNLQNDQGAASLAWRFTSNGATLDLRLGDGNIKPFQCLSVHRTNLSFGATAAVVGYQSGSQVFSVTGLPLNVVNGQGVASTKLGLLADRVRVAITEPNLQDGFVSIPLMYLGDLWLPARNMAPSSSTGTDKGVDEITSLSGVEFPQFRWQRRRYVIQHQSLGASEVATIRQMEAFANTGRNVLFLPDRNSGAVSSEALFGRMAVDDISGPFASSDRRATKFTFTERL